ncbi:hypothetical protein DI392_00520 [Vibrio albus]|uniref:Porin domain-containing protein n=1 Tax=Vibrio albus TaxID=2200953 RepID=A0A2U3BDI4_9VIBR|nr:porin [Vibrio albus]PWI34802.1 hypothetical protein DI392_00520 [Vibrio albus]
MKKTLVALAVVAAVGSAQAAEMYSMDGVTIDVNGEVGVKYIKVQDEADKSQLDLDEAKFGFEIEYEMTEDLAMGAYMDIEANNADDNVTRGDVYGSVTIAQQHVVTFGSQTTIFDEAGIGNDYEFGFTSYFEDLESKGDQVLKYKYNGNEVFSAGVAYAEYRNTTGYTDSDYELDGKISANVEDASFTLYLAHGEKSDVENDAYVLEARYRLGDLRVAGSYGSTDGETDDADMYGVTATFDDGGRFNYGVGWAITDYDDGSKDTVNDTYANVTYIFTDEVKVYAEVGFTDEDDTDTGYVVGMSATF